MTSQPKCTCGAADEVSEEAFAELVATVEQLAQTIAALPALIAQAAANAAQTTTPLIAALAMQERDAGNFTLN